MWLEPKFAQLFVKTALTAFSFFPLMLKFFFFMMVSFCFLRFLGNKVFNSSALIVRLGSEIAPQVKFFRSLPVECQNSELLCKVTMHESSVSRSYYYFLSMRYILSE